MFYPFYVHKLKLFFFLPTNRTNKHKYFYFKQITQIYKLFYLLRQSSFAIKAINF